MYKGDENKKKSIKWHIKDIGILISILFIWQLFLPVIMEQISVTKYKKEENEIKNFLREMDKELFRMFDGTDELFEHQGKEVVGIYKDGSEDIIYATEEGELKEKYYDMLNKVRKYYGNEELTYQVMRMNDVAFLRNKVAFVRVSGYKECKKIYPDVKILDVSKDYSGRKIITCAVESDNRSDFNPKYLIYTFRKYGKGKYEIIHDDTIKAIEKIVPTVSKEHIELKGIENDELILENIFDRDNTTKGEVYDATTDIGETLTFEFDKSILLEDIVIMDGDRTSNDTYNKSNRITKVKIELSNGDIRIVNFKSSNWKDGMRIPMGQSIKTEYVKLTVLDADKRYEDNGAFISDIYFFSDYWR